MHTGVKSSCLCDWCIAPCRSHGCKNRLSPFPSRT